MRSFPALFVFLVCLVAIRPSAAAAPVQWLEIKSPHFTVLTDDGERQARHTAGQLERMHAAFAKLLPNATDDPGAPIVVLALRDRKDFQTVEPAAYLAKDALNLAGLFLRGNDKNYILLRLDGSGDHPYNVIYHEYTHYLNRRAEFLPLWLNEGLAQFYQNTEFFDRDVRLGGPSVNDILFLRQKSLLPLQTLFLVDHTSPYYHEEDKGNIFYAESWALTHFLFMEDFGKKDSRLSLYTHDLAHGEGPVAAAQHAFGDLNQLQKQLEGYIQHGSYRELSMQLQNTVDEKAFAVQPIPTTDADALRADVLARDGRTQEAEALDHAILAQAPENAQAHETLGLIAMRNGDLAAARKDYGEAVALHSTSFLAYYQAGALALREGVPNAPESAAGNLQEAIRLNPTFAPAYIALAQFDAAHNERLDEAVTLCLKAVGLDPRNIDYRLVAAQIRVARHELPSAISILQATAKLAQTPQDQARIQARLDQLQTYQAQTEQLAVLRSEGAAEMAAEAARPKPSGPAAITDRAGNVLHPYTVAEPDHKFPEAPAASPKHTVTGTIHNVGCFYPKGMTLRIEGAKTVALYSNDMYAVAYTAGNFTPKGELNPCNQFDGLKAKVTYAEVDDPSVAGQILAMELNK